MLNADGENSAVTGVIALTRPGSGGGGSGGGGGAPTGSPGTPQPVTAGGTVWSGGTSPTESQPVIVGVTSPVAGTVTVSTSSDDAPHTGDRPVMTLTIDAPAASAAHPLDLTFKVDVNKLPEGSFAGDVTIFRNGAPVGALRICCGDNCEP
jgi:hypothetical protein